MTAGRPRWLSALWVCLGLLVVPLAVVLLLKPAGPPPRSTPLSSPAVAQPAPPQPAVSSSAAEPDGLRTLTGTISDEDDNPIAEAEVAITGWGRLRTFSDSKGAYRLRSVPLGEIELVVSAPGYWEERLPLGTGARGRVEQVDVALQAAPPVEGIVVDRAGKPVAQAAVTCTDRPDDSGLVTTTAVDGRFTLPSKAAGCRGKAKHAAFGDSREVLLRVGDGNRLQLGDGGAIAGVVVDQDGSPIQRFVVAVESHRRADRSQPGRGRGLREDVVDPNGRFELRGLDEGTYVLTASADGRPPGRSESITLQSGEQVRGIRIVLSAGGTLRGAVLDGETGEAIAGAVVVLDGVAQPKPRRTAVARSDAAGQYELPGAPTGPFSVRISAPGYQSRVVPSLRTKPGGTTQRDFELRLRGEGDGAVEYAGIGAMLATRSEGIVVAMIVPAGPAEGAGLKAQDLLLRVDGQDATGWTVAQAVQHLRGPAGSRVSVRVRRQGGGEHEVVITRAKFAR